MIERRAPLKRSAPPKRKKPIARSTKPLKRTEISRSKSPRRSPTKTKPPTRRKTNPEIRAERERIREEVFRRDRYRCRLAGVAGAGRCFGPLTPHHRRKSGQGGTYSIENLVALCAHHNDQLEADVKLVAIAKALDPPLVLDRYGARVERFWSLVDKHGPVNSWKPKLGRCWFWTGGKFKNGYGGFHDVDHSTIYAHRFSLSLAETLDPALEVDHLCRTPLCVRPSHLEQVTPAENRRRQGDARRKIQTHCKRGHEFTAANTGRYRNGSRYCLACQRARSKENRRLRKEQDERLRTDRSGSSRKGPAHEAPGAPRTRPPSGADSPPASRRNGRTPEAR